MRLHSVKTAGKDNSPEVGSRPAQGRFLGWVWSASPEVPGTSLRTRAQAEPRFCDMCAEPVTLRARVHAARVSVQVPVVWGAHADPGSSSKES